MPSMATVRCSLFDGGYFEAFNPLADSEVGHSPHGGICKISPSYQWNVTFVLFVHSH